MSMTRNVGLANALRYKGGGPMLTFILHRLGGMGMAVFIGTHVLASFIGGDVGRFLNDIYQNWVFQLLVFFFVMFHALNGLRITILDLFPALLVHQKEAIMLEWAVFIPLYAFAAYSIISVAFGG